jgi:hypothetical protein
MTTVAKLKIKLYENDREVTDLNSCNSADTIQLERSINSFIKSMMMAGLTREQRKEMGKLFGPDDVINVTVERDDNLEISAEGKFTNDFLNSKTGKKLMFSLPKPKRAHDNNESDNNESNENENGEDCLSHITHMKIDNLSGGRRRKNTRRHRRRSNRRRVTRKA